MPNNKNLPKKLPIAKMVIAGATKKRNAAKKEAEKIKKQEVPKPVVLVNRVKTDIKQEISKINFKEKVLKVWSTVKGFLSSLLKASP
jgi:hypothetical protein